MKKIIIFLLCLYTLMGYAQIPSGYYQTANGKSGRQLQFALCNIIDSHQVVSYNLLWTYFGETD
ncbi:MAG: hypothetical protein RR356_05975, partial [Bacteroidales bacterium]